MRERWRERWSEGEREMEREGERAREEGIFMGGGVLNISRNNPFILNLSHPHFTTYTLATRNALALGLYESSTGENGESMGRARERERERVSE